MSGIKLLIIAFVLNTLTPLVYAEVSITGTLASDYVFRGISQTDSSPAAQLGINYEGNSGFYTGAWASNVDFGNGSGAEVDFIVGYAKEASQTFAYDLNYIHMTYSGYDNAADSNYGEFILNTHFNGLTMTFAYSPDFANVGKSAQYLSATYNWYFPDEYLLKLQTGYSMGDAFKDAEYIDYSATVAKTWNNFELTAAVINTNIDNNDTADLRAVFSIYRTF